MDADHHEYLNNDKNLQSLDILVLAETKLSKELPDNKLKKYLYNFRVEMREDSPEGLKNMGIMVLLPSKSKYLNTGDIEIVQKGGNGDYQSVSIKVDHVLLTCLYIKPNKGSREMISCLLTDDIIKQSNVLMGDLNLNPAIKCEMQRIEELCQDNQLFMSLKEETRRKNQLDHIFVQNYLAERVFSTSFFNFMSDHKSIVIRIGGEGNMLSDEARQKIHHRDS